MKIIQLVFHLGAGGAEKFVTDLSNALHRKGHEVAVLMIRDASLPEFNYNIPFLDKGIRIISLGLPTGFHPGQPALVRKALEKERPDIVHGHLGVMPYVYRYSLKRKDIAFIHTIHSIPSFDIKNPLLHRLARYFYKRTITPVAISRICSRQFEQRYGFKAETIDNGRDIPAPGASFEVLAKTLSTAVHPLFIHVSRYAPEKNQAVLLDAFAGLKQEGVGFTLLIIGGGYEDDPSLQRYASDSIRFLGPKENVCDYLRLADGFCLSSLVEGSPLSLIEALGCGATPVCTPAGGIPDIIQDGETGYLSDGFSKEAYLKALHAFIAQPLNRERLMRHYLDHYTMDICADRYLKLYKACKR